MPQHQQTKILPYTLTQIYQLIIDVDNYSKFLPWCSASKITEQHDDYFLAELVIKFKVLNEKYVSHITPNPPAANNAKIIVRQHQGPFAYLSHNWHLTAISDEKCKVNIDIEFSFKSVILNKIAGALFGKTLSKMINAFEDRARELYG
ncbi:MAG: type II toxin-antitoxin system RatA family toxin [Pseudomonadota bacterium]